MDIRIYLSVTKAFIGLEIYLSNALSFGTNAKECNSEMYATSNTKL